MMAANDDEQAGMGSLELELQPLMHQLVFESKVHSVLYAGTITWLSRGFRLWQLLVQGENNRALSGELQAAQRLLREHTMRLEPVSRKGTADYVGPRLRASRELEAFRSAREELLRESGVGQQSRGGTDMPGLAGPSSTPGSLQEELQSEKWQVARLREEVHSLRDQLRDQEALEQAKELAESQLEAHRGQMALLSAQESDQRALLELTHEEIESRTAEDVAMLSRRAEELQCELETVKSQAEEWRQSAAEAETLRQQLDASVRQTARLRIELSEQQSRVAEVAASNSMAEERALAAEAARAEAERLTEEALATAEAANEAARTTGAASSAEAAAARVAAAEARAEAESARAAAEREVRLRVEEQLGTSQQLAGAAQVFS